MKPRNGWTKETMIRAISEGNKGRQSTSDKALDCACAYRGDGNNKCAIGCFIPDELYIADMDDSGNVENLLEEFPDLKEHMPLPTYKLTSLQDIHDLTPPNKDPRPSLIKWIKENVE